MSYLLDTNVISELRKRHRCNSGVAKWFSKVSSEEIFLSVVTLGELRKGIENIRRRDSSAAQALESWFYELVVDLGDRIIPIDQRVAEEWGRFNVPDPLAVIDSMNAAAAKVHGLTLVTRNVKDVRRTGVALLNPFSE